MAGRKPPAAITAFLEPLQTAASCITRAVFTVTRMPGDVPQVLFLNHGKPVRLRSRDWSQLSLSASMRFRVVPAEGARGPWKVTTVGYQYRVCAGEREVLAYHFHPDTGVPFPHLHVAAPPPVRRMHLPTGRVAFEAVVRLLITEFRVRHLDDDWEERLRRTQALFEQWRTWW